MRIGIIGGGSIGLLMAALLAEQGHIITIYVKRVEQKKTINQDGLTIRPYNKVYPVTALLLEDRLTGEDDLVLVCVKQYQLKDIYRFTTNSSFPIIFMQNGMDHVEEIQQLELTNTIILASSEHGAIRVSDSVVNHTGRGQLNMAILAGDSSLLISINHLLTSDNFPIEINENWFYMLANKLIINAVINPITAIFQVNNGQIISNPYLFKLSNLLCNEVCHVLKLEHQEQWKRIMSVATNTKDNKSSMHLDVVKQRRTEIEGILGYIIKQSNGDLPHTLFVYQSIKALEWNYKGK
ncbi:2-dehydropantoate 2-reductase [Aquibacillus saliphilus]|uniref:2-dehydropantoate 2-reductase n=1 Tax=Aquibacillus saliphilus TaxID=1909422 RepID=UPI001CEFE2AA|nr:2-dehydropantoate 2-reductase [Aquibacillus saliphilus]